MKKIALAILLLCTGNAFAATRNFVPRGADEGNVGLSTKPWHAVYATKFYGDGSDLTGLTVSETDPLSVHLLGSYSNPTWLTSILGSIVLGDITGKASNITGNLPASQVAAGSLGSGVIASSIAVGAVQDASIVAVSGSKVSGNISGQAGSVANGVYTTGSYSDPTWLTAVAGSKVSGDITGRASNITGNLPTSQIAAGTLPSNVIASSIAAGSVQDSAIVGVSGSKVSGNISGNAATASALATTPTTCAAGQVSTGVDASGNAVGCFTPPGSAYTADETSLNLVGTEFRANPSSVTLQGNTFNGNNQLVKLDGTGKMPAVDGTNMTGVIKTTATDTYPLSISGNAATATNATTVTNGVYTSGSYADPAWITSLAGSKVAGNISGQAGTVANGVYTTGSYADPTWITSIAGSKVSGNISGQAGSVANGVYTTGSYSDPAWITGLAGSKISGNISGNAGTATALAAHGTNCSAGQAALGVDASGNAEGCWTPGTVGDNLGNHTGTQALNMQSYGVNTSSSVNAGVYEISGQKAIVMAPDSGYAFTKIGIDSSSYNPATNQYGTFVGAGAGRWNTGGYNTYTGRYSGVMNTIGGNNTGAGAWSLYHSSGTNNTGVGFAALYGDNTGPWNTNYNVGVGNSAGYSLKTGNYNTLIGPSAGYNLVTGSDNILIGHGVDVAGTSTGDQQLNIGDVILGKLDEKKISINDTHVTSLAGTLNIRNANFNIPIIVARNSVDTIVSSMSNTGVWTATGFNGPLTGNADTVTNGVYTTGNQTIGGIKTFTSGIVGNIATASALYANGTNCSAGQAALGVDAFGNAEGCWTPGTGAGDNLGNHTATTTLQMGNYQVRSSSSITTVDYLMGANDQPVLTARGAGSIFVGTRFRNAELATTTGDYNTMLGYSAGKAITSGMRNTHVGYYAGPGVTTGSDNVFVGQGAGRQVTVGSSNTVVGAFAGYTGFTGSNNILLGYGVELPPGSSGNNSLNIGNLIYGTIGGSSVTVNGDLWATKYHGDGSLLTNLPAGTESDPVVKAINGIVKSNGSTISAASAGTDYLAPNGSAANLTNFPILNQNTSGNAATATALAANGTNCSAGQAALGVDAFGNAEGCWSALPIAGGTVTGDTVFSGTVTINSLKFANQAPASGTSVTPDSNYNVFVATAAGGGITINNPSGTPSNGTRMIIRLKDDGTARAITWGAAYRASSDLAKPTTTVANKVMYIGIMYNSVDAKWDILALLGNI